MSEKAIWDHHIHTDVSEQLEDDKSLEGQKFQGAEHGFGIDELLEIRSEVADRYIVTLAEHDEVPRIEIYADLLGTEFDVEAEDDYLLASREDLDAVVIPGAQVNARNEEGIQKDVICNGVGEGFRPEADSPEDLYSVAASESEMVTATHVNVMPEWLPSSLDLKYLDNQDLTEIGEAARQEGKAYAVGLPTMFPAPMNMMARRKTETDESIVNEMDLHHLRYLEGNTRGTNIVDGEVFESFWDGDPDYERLIESSAPTGTPSTFESVARWQDFLQEAVIEYRLKPMLRGWKPERDDRYR